MPRDSGGNFTNEQANFVPQTPARAQEVNKALNDLGNAATDSLSRSGKGGMLAPLRVTDGSSGNPSYSFTSEPGVGFYHSATYSTAWVAQGATVWQWNLTNVACNRPLSVTANVSDTTALTVQAQGTAIGAALNGGTGVANGAGGLGAAIQGGTGAGTGAGGVGANINGGVSAAGVRAPAITGTGGMLLAGAPLTPDGTAQSNTYRMSTDPVPTGVATGKNYPFWSWMCIAGGNTANLSVRWKTRGVGNFDNWNKLYPTISLDIDTVVAAGSQLEWSAGAMRLTRGPSLTPGPSSATVSSSALDLYDGGLGLMGTSPGPSVAISGTLHAVATPKAYALLTFGGGGTAITVTDAMNTASVTMSAGVITVTFAAPFATATYGMSYHHRISGAVIPGAVEMTGTPTTSAVQVIVRSLQNNGQGVLERGTFNTFTSGDRLDLFFFGRQ